jgi:hypothetical protein
VQNNQPINAAQSEEDSDDDVEIEVDDGDDERLMIDKDKDITQELEGNFFDDVVPDDAYDPSGMEEDGAYAQEFDWQYENVPDGGIQEEHYCYSGAGPSLRHNIANKFSTPLGACGVAGGFTYELIKCITANSNAYGRQEEEKQSFRRISLESHFSGRDVPCLGELSQQRKHKK